MRQASGKRRLAKNLILPAALLATAATALPANPIKMPTRAQLRACPAFADLDFRAIARNAGATRPEWRAEMDQRHARTRGPYSGFGAPQDARITLRIWAGPGETQEHRSETSSLVWLGSDGVWRLDRVDHVLNRPPPPKPPPPPDADGLSPPPERWSQEEVERLIRVHAIGEVEPDEAYGIESALANPCFAMQPDSMPFNVPVKKGKTPRNPCWGVIGGTLEIIWSDGRRRDVTELCGGFYANGIINAVMYARPFIEDADTKAYCDGLRRLAAPAAAELRELAFCEAGLSAELRKRGLSEAKRQALFADAQTLATKELPNRYNFLSLWSAGALKRAIEASQP